MVRSASQQGDQEQGEEMTDLVVFPRHIRSAKLCMKGAREWHQAHGLRWSDCVTKGTSVEFIDSTGCPIAARAAAEARKEAERGIG